MKKFIALAALFFLPLSVLAASEFQPLTSIPAVSGFKADSFAAFFNQLYIICVGAAAVIAVLQFIRAGVYYSLTDTGVTEKREARHMMVMSVTGLILVLSPTIVFGIINPDILNLKIGIENLDLSPVDRVQEPAGGGGGSASNDTSCTSLNPIIRNESGAPPTSAYAPSVWYAGGEVNDAKTACCSAMDAVGGQTKCTVKVNGSYVNWCDCSQKTSEVVGAQYVVDSIYVTYSSLIFSEMGSTESNSVYVLKPGSSTTYPSNAACEKTYNSMSIADLKSKLASFEVCYKQMNTGFVKYSCTGTITADNSNYSVDKTVCTIKK